MIMKTPLQRCLLRPLVQRHQSRLFHATRRRDVIKPFLLADIGEGIRECQIIQWFVQPGARVEQFDKVCEVQSDKAAVEITSPFDGLIKELHYEPDDMALVGKPLLDIDIQSEISPEDEAKLADPSSKTDHAEEGGLKRAEQAGEGDVEKEEISGPLGKTAESRPPKPETVSSSNSGKHASLATPAVRRLLKEYDILITDITGSGKDGRVLKEDVHRHMSSQTSALSSTKPTSSPSALSNSPSPSPSPSTTTPTPLTPVQAAMFKTMTASLKIPHFLYTTPMNLTPLTALRNTINSDRSPAEKLSPLPFIIKAVSQALLQHPLLNASLSTTGSDTDTDTDTDTDSDTESAKKPTLTYNTAQNFGIAVATPAGLLVPVLRDVQALSVAEIGARIKDLAARARDGKLARDEMRGATFTVSNIGAMGAGGVVAPVVVAPQVAILGVGRARAVPHWDEQVGGWVKRDEAVMSWSADHRVVDGAECARAAERVCALVENVGGWAVELR